MSDMATNVVLAGSAAFGSFGSVGVLGWWLSGRFRSVEVEQRKSLDAHEEKDQQRHEANLERFREISVALARSRK